MSSMRVGMNGLSPPTGEQYLLVNSAYAFSSGLTGQDMRESLMPITEGEEEKKYTLTSAKSFS